jgi:hypothetical protein
MKIPKNKLAYLAGIIDGEGNISIVKGNIKRPNFYFSGYVQVANTNKILINWLVENFKGKTCWESKPSPNSKLKGYWVLKDCSILLNSLLPFLILKKEQAKLVIEFRKTVKPLRGKRGHFHKSSPELIKVREDLWAKCRVLNKRGI